MKRLLVLAALLAITTIAVAYTSEELLQMKRYDPARYMQDVLGMDATTAQEQAKAAAVPPLHRARPGRGQRDAAGGPDGYGYIYKDETETGGPTYNWIDTVGATSASITGDDNYGTISLPFTFVFYGNNYTSCYPSTNGWMGLASGSSGYYSNYALPTTNLLANSVCAYWDDLYAPGGSNGNIMYKTVGSSPNRQFVVIWDSVYTLSGSYYMVFEVILSEADMSVTYQYRYLDANARGGSATVGEQNLQTGSNYLQYSYLSSSLIPGRAIKFWKPSYATDVGVYRINRPNGLYTAGTINPSVVIKNFGTSSQSNIGVKLDIGSGYSNTVTVAGPLAAGDTYVVTSFPSWNANTPGQYAVRCSTRLAGDQDNANDRKTANAVIATFVEYFDASNGNYTVFNQTNGHWTWRAPAYPRPAPPSTPNAWTEPDSAAYTAYDTSWVVSCTYVSSQDTPVAIFYHRCSTESYCDGGNFAYSTDGGTNWTVLYPDTAGGKSRPYYGTLYQGEQGWCGYFGWEMAWFKIPVANATGFKLRFKFMSDGSVQYSGGGWMFDNLAGVGFNRPAADVGAQRIIAPTGTIQWGVPVTPSAKVYNYGTASQTFKVRFQVDSVLYIDSTTVSNLAGGDSATVNFTSWTPDVAGSHAVKCSTRLAGDQAPSNDKASGSITVSLVDAGAICIVQPLGGGSVDSGASISPRCSVMNYGSSAATFDVDLKIGAGYSATGTASSVPPNSKRIVVFTSQNWTPTARGWVAMSCSTKLSGDMRTNNDRKLDSVFVRVRDIGVVQITSPTGVLLPGPVTPTATVRNNGNQREACKVFFRINATPAYLDSVVLANGLPYADTSVSFTDWTAVSGSFMARCSTVLTGDMKRTNDTASVRFVVGSVDAAVTAILAPVGSADTSVLQTPSAKVKNLGSAPATGVKVYFNIDSTPGSSVYLDSVTTDIGAGAEVTKTFKAWPKPYRYGTFLTKCKAVAFGDNNHANDSLTGTFTFSSAPPGWYIKTPMPAGAKPAKDGAWIDYDAGTKRIYASRGNKQPDFFAYDPKGDSWGARAPWQPGTEAKLPQKSSAGCADGNGVVWATKGNSTLGFWKYEAAANAWTQKKDVPLGTTNKKLKGGSGITWAYKGGVGSPFLLKGYKNEFYRYDVPGDSWQTLTPAPVGAKEKWDKGSWLAYDDVNNKVYAFKAKYMEFYSYNPNGDSWSAALAPMPAAGPAGSKKAKDGSCGTYFTGGSIFALKGGNTQELWKYTIASNAWTALETIPRGTAKKKVKAGGSITTAGVMIYAIKGNKSDELWQYSPGSYLFAPPRHDGVLAGKTVIAQGISISPNPLASGFAVLRYGLPKAGAAEVNIYNVAGQQVMAQTFTTGRSGTVNLDLRHLSNGVYLVKLSGEGFANSQKLVVQR